MISGGSATLQQPPPPAASTAVSSTASGMAYPYPTPTITPHHHYQPSTTYHHQYHHGAQVQYCATTPTIAPPPTHYDHDHRPPSMTTWGTFVFQPAPMPASSNSACYHVPNPLDAIAAAYPPSAASAAPPVGMTTMMQPVSHEHIVSRSSCPTAHTNYNTTAGTTKTAPSTHVPSSSYVNEVVETYDYKKRKVAKNNDNMEEQKDKLAAVDAIFAAGTFVLSSSYDILCLFCQLLLQRYLIAHHVCTQSFYLLTTTYSIVPLDIFHFTSCSIQPRSLPNVRLHPPQTYLKSKRITWERPIMLLLLVLPQTTTTRCTLPAPESPSRNARSTSRAPPLPLSLQPQPPKLPITRRRGPKSLNPASPPNNSSNNQLSCRPNKIII